MRYLPLDAAEREVMLTRIGVPDIDALFADIPTDRRIEGLLDMPLAMSEMAVERRLSAMASLSVAAGSVPFFLGAGAYKRHVPATVDHLIQRSEFLTSYTPYQPEISQGTLQVLFEFQTQVANADRHGGRQCIDVRRLDRLWRRDADGPPAHRTTQGGYLWRVAPAVCRHRGDARAYGRRLDPAACARPEC